MKIEKGQVLPGASGAEFPLLKMHTFASNIYHQYNMHSLTTREEFLAKLDKGINDLQTKLAQ